MNEPQPNSDAPVIRSRAHLIRECAAAGMTNKQIRQACIVAGFVEPTKQALYRAKSFDFKDINPRIHTIGQPTYRAVCEDLIDCYNRAVRSGAPIAITVSIKECLDAIDMLLTYRKAVRNKPRKRKPKRKPKPKPPVTNHPEGTRDP